MTQMDGLSASLVSSVISIPRKDQKHLQSLQEWVFTNTGMNYTPKKLRQQAYLSELGGLTPAMLQALMLQAGKLPAVRAKAGSAGNGHAGSGNGNAAFIAPLRPSSTATSAATAISKKGGL